MTSFALAADGSMLYELFAGGSLYKYATAANTWTRLDTNVTSFALAADGSMLYELFAGGSLYRVATAANTWTRLDANVTSFALAADGSMLSSCLPAGAALQVRHGGEHLDPPRPGCDLVRPGAERHALQPVRQRRSLPVRHGDGRVDQDRHWGPDDGLGRRS